MHDAGPAVRLVLYHPLVVVSLSKVNLQKPSRTKYGHPRCAGGPVCSCALYLRTGCSCSLRLRTGAPGAERPRSGGALSSVARAFRDQPSFVKQFVALQHFFFVPSRTLQSETEPRAVAPQFRGPRIGRGFGECRQREVDGLEPVGVFLVSRVLRENRPDSRWSGESHNQPKVVPWSAADACDD